MTNKQSDSLLASPDDATGGAAGRVLAMLVVLGSRLDGLSVTELARECDCSVPTASRQMALLLKFGLARLDPTSRRYQLGLRVFELGQAMQFENTIRQAAAPVLAELARTSHCLASLDALENGDVVTLEVKEAATPVQVRLPVGFRAPAFGTASGRAALSTLDNRQIETIRARSKPPVQALDPALFDAVRQTGYAFNDAEAEPYINAIGVPLTFSPGSLPLAVSIAAPSFLLSRDALRERVPLLKKASESIASAILQQAG